MTRRSSPPLHFKLTVPVMLYCIGFSIFGVFGHWLENQTKPVCLWKDRGGLPPQVSCGTDWIGWLDAERAAKAKGAKS